MHDFFFIAGCSTGTYTELVEQFFSKTLMLNVTFVSRKLIYL